MLRRLFLGLLPASLWAVKSTKPPILRKHQGLAFLTYQNDGKGIVTAEFRDGIWRLRAESDGILEAVSIKTLHPDWDLLEFTFRVRPIRSIRAGETVEFAFGDVWPS